jgi:Family of unknown function (DUF5995)
MFPYDAQLAAAAQTPPQSIPAVLQLMQTIDNTCVDGDGLKWFNWLYFQVTQAVENRVAAGGFNDPAWLAELDVQFAQLYFNALYAALTGAPCPGCWQALFSCRQQTRIARIQFALAGMNAHINHDLPLAIVSTCKTGNTVPQHGNAQYNDYTALNTTLDSLIDTAKQALHVRLLGDPLPPVSHLEDLIAAWNLAAAREQAWNAAECLWQDSAFAAGILMDTIDGLTTVIGKALLVPVP